MLFRSQIVLALACFLWAWTAYGIYLKRIDEGRNPVPSVIIFSVVILINLTALLLFQTRRLRTYYQPPLKPDSGPFPR